MPLSRRKGSSEAEKGKRRRSYFLTCLLALAAASIGFSDIGAASERRQILVDGAQRQYRIFIPSDLERSRAAAVIALHGALQSAAEFEADFGMNRVAEREKFIVIYPEGINLSWDDARPPIMRLGYVVPTGDDVAFLTALIRSLAREGIVDPRQVYMTGLSMGGFMTVRMACERPDLFAGIAIMAATVPERYQTACGPARALPALLMHGTMDTISSWYGLPVPGARLLSVTDSAQYYANRAGCMIHSDSILPARSGSMVKVKVRRWSICNDNSSILLYAIEGGGHMPPSHQPGRGETFVSIFLPRRSHAIDAAEEIWRFFRQFRQTDLVQHGTRAQ